MDVNEYLNTVWLGNTIGTWLTALGILAVGIGLLVAVKALVIGKVFRFASRSANEIDDLLVELLRRTRMSVLIVLVVAAVVFLVLVVPAPARTFFKFVAVIALFFQGMAWGNGIISFWMQRYAVRRGMTTGPSAATVGALVFLVRIALFVVLLLFSLDNLGFAIAPLIMSLGIGGIAVALAVQNILGDLLAALSIILDKPFVVGDFIVIDTHMGTVEHIGLKSTRIRSLTGEQVIIGNADLLKARINNHKRRIERRSVFTVGVTYDMTPGQLQRIPVIIREAVERQELTRFDRSHFSRYGDSALEFESVFWVLSPDYNAYMDIQHAVNVEVFTRFGEEGIEFAYPTRTLHIAGGSLHPSDAHAR
jgi:small-conductance mechanosensitive channel